MADLVVGDSPPCYIDGLLVPFSSSLTTDPVIDLPTAHCLMMYEIHSLSMEEKGPGRH